MVDCSNSENIMTLFCKMTDDEIMTGYTLCHTGIPKTKDNINPFLYDVRLYRLAEMWIDSECDKVQMRLKYYEEIAWLESEQQTFWFNRKPINRKLVLFS